MNEAFKEGDLIILKDSTDPILVIESINPNSQIATCIWFDDNYTKKSEDLKLLNSGYELVKQEAVMNEPIKVGDQVTLKGGQSPIMVIESINPNSQIATCIWFDENQKRSEDLKLATLLKYEYVFPIYA